MRVRIVLAVLGPVLTQIMLILLLIGSGILFGQKSGINPSLSREYFLKGSARYNVGDCESAVKWFSDAIKYQPSYAAAYYGRSLSWYCAGNYTEALKDINSAMKYLPGQAMYFAHRGLIKLAQKDLKSGQADFFNALSIDSTCWSAYINIASVEHFNNNTTRSVYWLTLGLKHCPKHPQLLFHRGIYEFRSALYPEAISDFSECLHENPGLIQGYYYRSQCKLFLGDAPGALEDATVFQQSVGEVDSVYCLLATIHFQQKNLSAAQINIEKNIKLNSKNASAYFLRAEMKLFMNDSTGAIADLSKGLKLAPGRKEVLLRRAEINAGLRKYKLVITDLTSYLKLKPASPSVQLDRAKAYMALEDWQSAMKDLQSVQKSSPNLPEPSYLLGLCKYQSGNVVAACQEMKKAADLGYSKAAEWMGKNCTK